MGEKSKIKITERLTRKLDDLVLCEYLSNGRKIKRWLRPETVVEVPCKQCGHGDFTYARDASTHVCMDCFACNEENVPNQFRGDRHEEEK